jgi:excinuclease ABC subunit C
MSTLREQVNNLPDEPGVYFFKQGETILYIGKATSLRDRVRSYFSSDLNATRGPLIVRMVEEADRIDFQTTESVLEALILEANLIRKHRPSYNSKEKDNKSYAYVVITDEDYPRLVVVRGRELQTTIDPDSLKYTFGPYPSGRSLREALKIIRKIFPFRAEGDEVEPTTRKSRLNQQIGLAPDFSRISQKDYARTVNHLRLFFQGRKTKLLRELERDMKKFAKEERFEDAAEAKRQIAALRHVRDMSLIRDVVEEHKRNLEEQSFRVEAYDIAHISGTDMVGVMVVVEDGFAKKSDYRKFKIRRVKDSNDPAALREVLERRLNHTEWPYPRLFVIDGGKAQLNVAQKVLATAGIVIPVVSVVKNERHQARDILGDDQDRDVARANENAVLLASSEAHRFAISYHRDLRKRSSGL